MAEYEKQHYIPQFWIKYFCDNKDDYVYFVSKKTGKGQFVKTKEIFYYKNLYDHDKRHRDIKHTEKNFGKQEAGIKPIIDKLQFGREIVLTKDEYNKLILFLHILGFRNKKGLSDMRKHKNDNNIDNALKSISQDIDGTEDAWRTVLEEFSNIQCVKDIEDYHKASRSVRTQLQFMVKYFHVNVFECKEGTLVLSDMLPITQQIDTQIGKQAVIYCYPISKTRMLVSSFNGLNNLNDFKSLIPLKKLAPPHSDKTHVKLRVSTIYLKQVEELNKAFKNYCTEGYIE